MSYNSKYTGQQVENLLDQVAQGGGITEETDPIFSASPAAQITDENISSWNNKVDKVDGKQLSTEDFTTLLKQKLDGLSNYDDTEISQAVSKLRTDLDTLVSGDTTNAIKTFNEVIAFLDGISDTEDLSSIIASIEQQIAAKAGKSEIPTKVSQLENDEGYLTSHQDISHLATKDDLQSKADDASVVHKTGNETISGAKTFNSGVNFLGNGDSNAVTLSTNTRINVYGTNHTVFGFASGSFYISHGNYNLVVRGKASRPAYNGSDMALLSDVNDKQDKITDLQTIREGAAKGATAIQSHQDISGKQDKLVSGTNIKTINGTSILGSGNIVIEGGGGSSSGGSGAYAEVNHGTSDTTFALTPNTFHVWDEVASLDLSFADEQAGVANEYLFQFTSGATATTLTLPDVKWANDAAPLIEANKIYQISVLKGLGSVLSFSNEIKLFPVTLVVGETSQQGADVYAYMYDKYGEITTPITEEMYFIRDEYPIAVGTIEYGTFEGLTGYWLNGYISTNLKQVLTQDGSLIKRFPIYPEMT